MKRKKRHAPTGPTLMEDKFIADLQELCPEIGIVREHTPSIFGKRKYRIDAWVEAYGTEAWVEIQGGGFRGGHSTMKGRTRDAEKLALANFAGVPLFHFTSPMVRSGQAAEIMDRFLRAQLPPASLTEPPRTRRLRRRKK